LLDHLYGQIAAARRRWYERHPEARRRLRRPVISIGNLSVGGTGKTPLVAQLAEWLIAHGERPAILSRGYKRHIADAGVTVVADGAATLSDVTHAGDEPVMLARAVPGAIVCVAEDRHLAGALAERVLGATVHVLDDGFQHVQLARDLDILVTSPGEIARGRVLPFGRLREPRAAAARAHFAVVVGAGRDEARAEAWELGVSAFSAARRHIAPTDAPSAIAVAGLGQPEQFFALLRDSGVAVKDTIAFPDHHRYTAADAARIERTLAASNAATVITTEKDAVRLESLGALPFAWRAAPMRLVLDDWDALTAAVGAALARAREAA
jgi:tetraacyldisaccharide 4'-kinase